METIYFEFKGQLTGSLSFGWFIGDKFKIEQYEINEEEHEYEYIIYAWDYILMDWKRKAVLPHHYDAIEYLLKMMKTYKDRQE